MKKQSYTSTSIQKINDTSVLMVTNLKSSSELIVWNALNTPSVKNVKIEKVTFAVKLGETYGIVDEKNNLYVLFHDGTLFPAITDYSTKIDYLQVLDKTTFMARAVSEGFTVIWTIGTYSDEVHVEEMKFLN
mmetsp:Transcript_20925/g.18261  ORF Transcript_20925/g.18261 Transcript_20925/m.18261 type:complete len:132 (-) Transcript_20925:47-442(-)